MNETEMRDVFDTLTRNPVPSRYDSASARVASARQQRRKWSTVGAVVLVGAVVAGSAALFRPVDTDPAPRPEVFAPIPSPFTLTGEWRVTALFDTKGHSILTDPLAEKLRVIFRLGNVTVTTGCTYVRTAYYLDGPTNSDDLWFFPTASRERRSCRNSEPRFPGDRLLAARRISEKNGSLHLEDENGQTIAELEPAPRPTPPGLASGERYAQSNFPRNEFGQTYGSDALAETFAETPDLIAVQGIGGRIGFIKKTDSWPILHPTFKSPEDAAAYSQKVRKNPPRAIPVYELDGKTQIDWFRYGNGGSEARDRNGKVTRTIREGN